jgi:Prenyltransferase and squalene oxidase repeat
MNRQQIIDWLLEGDVSIQYQVWRDLLGVDKRKLQARIADEGWGQKYLSKQNSDGHWGDGFYQPKWTSTFYTLLDLRNLNCPSNNRIAKEAIELVLQNGKADDGGIPLGSSTTQYSDVCANGMFLNYASYFEIPEKQLYSIIDCILNEIMPDGGFNCRTKRSGAKHSSLHSTISVLEGLTEFQKAGYTYKKDKIFSAKESAIEFILSRQLFLSDRTGQIINKDFLKLTYPYRWKYDILRAMDFFQYAGIEWDNRMKAAIDVLKSKQRNEGSWNMQAAHAGQVHFNMEKAGKPSRWNTLRVLRVMKHFKIE